MRRIINPFLSATEIIFQFGEYAEILSNAQINYLIYTNICKALYLLLLFIILIMIFILILFFIITIIDNNCDDNRPKKWINQG